LAEASAATNHSAPNNHAGLIWAIADLLRADYKRSEYGRVILRSSCSGASIASLEPSRCCSQRLPDVPALSRPCAYGAGATSSPSPDRAVETSRRPELTRPRLPFAQCQSRMRHFAGIPRSTAARTAGQASRVDPKRPRILLEGINLSEYPTAPSMTMPKPSASIRAYRPISTFPDSRMSAKSGLPVVVGMHHVRASRRAMRNDPGSHPVLGGLPPPDPAEIRVADRLEPRLLSRVEFVEPGEPEVPAKHRPGLVEPNAAFPDILHLLVGIPRVLNHAPETIDRLSSAAYFGRGPNCASEFGLGTAGSPFPRWVQSLQLVP